MAFSRDDLKAYEAQPVRDVPNTLNQAFGKTAPATESAPPAAPTPAPTTEASSAPEVESVPAESGDASSAVENVESATTSAESDGGSTSPATTTETAAPPSKTIPYERFQEVIEERNALKKYGELLYERFEALQNKPAAETVTAPTASTTPAPAPAATEAELLPPTLASVNYDEAAYQKEMAKWAVKVAEKTAIAVTTRQQTQQTEAQIVSTYNEREAAYAAAHPDFKVVTSIPLPKFAPDTARTILTDANGPAVVHHLAKNPDEAQRLHRMTPAQQLVRLGQILTQVTPAATPKPGAKPATQQRTVTKAPPPPKPTTGGSAPVTTGMPPSMAEFAQQERARKVAEQEQRRKMRTAMR